MLHIALVTTVFLENYWVLRIPGDLYIVETLTKHKNEVKEVKKWPDRVAHFAQSEPLESPAVGPQKSIIFLNFLCNFFI